jgi:hypothetical protein
VRRLANTLALVALAALAAAPDVGRAASAQMQATPIGPACPATVVQTPVAGQVQVAADTKGNLCAASSGPSTVTVTNLPTTVDTNTGGAGASTLRVVQATGSQVRVLGAAGGVVDAAGQNVAAPANELLIGGEFNTTPTTITSGNASPLQLDSAANLLVNVNTALPAGANTIGAVTQASGPWSENQTQVNSAAINTGTGASGTGTQRVAVSNDSSIALQPTSSSSLAIAPVVSAAAEGTHVFKASAGNLYSAYVTTGGTAGFLLIFNTTTAPADGAVTPIHCVQAPANTTVGVSFSGMPPESFSTGISAAFSTTGCFTKTVSATAFFHGSVQ